MARIQCTQRQSTAFYFSGITLSFLCLLYLYTGLRLVQAALMANPSINKNEKTTNLEAAKKIFDSGDRNGAPYPNKPNEEFVGYDTGSLAAEAQGKAAQASAKKTGGGGFWLRSGKK